MRLRIPLPPLPLLVAALAVVAIGCQITGSNGTWSITPVSGPPDVAATGQFTDPDTGKKYELWDTDGDGKADYLRDEDGKTYRVEPMLPQAKSLASGAHAGPATPAGARPWWNLYLNPPDEPLPVTFTQSAADYLHEHGLDAVVPGHTAVLSSGLVVNDLDPQSLVADVTVAWTAALSFPDILEHPGLQYEFHELSDAPEDFGQYLSLRVVGPFLDVAGWLAELGVGQVKFPTDLGPFEMQLDGDAGTALVLLGGEVLYSGPLG